MTDYDLDCIQEALKSALAELENFREHEHDSLHRLKLKWLIDQVIVALDILELEQFELAETDQRFIRFLRGFALHAVPSCVEHCPARRFVN